MMLFSLFLAAIRPAVSSPFLGDASGGGNYANVKDIVHSRMNSSESNLVHG